MTEAHSAKPKLLIVEDDESYARRLAAYLAEEYECTIVARAEDAGEKIRHDPYHVILLDLDFGAGNMDGFEFLERYPRELLFTPIIVVTRFKEMEKIVRAIRLGAFNYFVKDSNMAELDVALVRALEWHRLKNQSAILREKLDSLENTQLIGQDRGLQKVCKLVEKIAPTKASVLLRGESGTGKGMIAKCIHDLSGRKGFLIDVNCPAIPETLLESELFGYVPGAFTGAMLLKPGYFEKANGGTLFLDEVGEIRVDYQRKLLKAIDEQVFFRVGGKDPVRVDVRIIAATSANLDTMITEGSFKSELFYRLNTFVIHLPPLRERRDDIPELVEYYIRHFSEMLKKKVHGITQRAVDYLMMYEWPGNVRQLKTTIERAVIVCDSGMIGMGDIGSFEDGSGDILPYKEAKDRFVKEWQKRYILQLLEATDGNVTKLAELSGLARVHCSRLIKELGIGRRKRSAL